MNNSSGILKKLWRKNFKYIATAVMLVLCSETLWRCFELLKGYMVDAIMSQHYKSASMYGIGMTVVILAVPTIFYVYSKNYQKFVVYSQRDMRKDVFEGTMGRSYPNYIEKSEGHYTNAYTNIISQLQFSYFDCLFGFLQIIASVITSVVVLLHIYPLFALLSILGMSIAVILPLMLKKKIVEYEKEVIASGEINISKLNEFLDGLEVIINFGRVSSFMDKFKLTTLDFKKKRTKWFVVMTLSFKLTEVILMVYNIICVIICAVLVSNGKLGVGDYIAALGIMNTVIMHVPYTSVYLQEFKAASENFKCLDGVIAFEENISGIIYVDEVQNVEVKGVSFAYPDMEEKILNNLSLSINESGVSIIEGKSGCGKTTLMSLLLGYYANYDGMIMINGTDVANIVNLNDLITVMRQENIFFDASLRDNLTMFSDVDDEKLIALMCELGLEKYASPEILDDAVGEYSGGEGRRMMFLRALLNDKSIIILDEPIANLDEESIARIESVLAKKRDRIIIVITHQELNVPIKFKYQLLKA